MEPAKGHPIKDLLLITRDNPRRGRLKGLVYLQQLYLLFKEQIRVDCKVEGRYFTMTHVASNLTVPLSEKEKSVKMGVLV